MREIVERRVRSNRIGFADFSGKPVQTNGTYRSTDCFAGKEGMIYEPWGDLPDEQIGGLQRAGWDLRFFTVPDRKYLPEWEDKYNAFVINQDKGQKYFVTVLPREVEEYPEADVVSFLR